MPNLNVKGETSKPSSSASHAGGGGSKVFMILIVVVIGLAALAFILNKTGVVKLWGKKKSQRLVRRMPRPTALQSGEAYSQAAIA